MPARRRGHGPRPRGLGRNPLRELALVGVIDLVRCAPSARRRAAVERGRPPTLYWIAPIPDLWPRFPPSARSGWPDGLSLPCSSRRNAPRGPISSRSRNLRFTPIPRGLVQSWNARGRRGGFAAHGAVATGRCCGPRYAAIWHANAHQLTTSRGPRDEALRDSATPTVAFQRRMEAGGRQIRNPKSEIP